MLTSFHVRSVALTLLLPVCALGACNSRANSNEPNIGRGAVGSKCSSGTAATR